MKDLYMPEKKPRKNQNLYYGKPFSYYYHGIEKKNI
jgi:hypothetical protein